MGYEEGCEQVGIFLDNYLSETIKLSSKGGKLNDVQLANLKQLISCLDVLGSIAAKLNCPDTAEMRKKYVSAKALLMMHLPPDELEKEYKKMRGMI